MVTFAALVVPLRRGNADVTAWAGLPRQPSRSEILTGARLAHDARSHMTESEHRSVATCNLCNEINGASPQLVPQT